MPKNKFDSESFTAEPALGVRVFQLLNVRSFLMMNEPRKSDIIRAGRTRGSSRDDVSYRCGHRRQAPREVLRVTSGLALR